MTTYTAEDFKRAEFASHVHRDGLAVRAYPHEKAAWLLVWEVEGKARCDDATMARSGSWAPVPAGSYTRTDEAASLRLAAEQIAEAQAEATAAVTAKEKAEQERDSWETIAQQTARSIDALRTAESRPLTPDAITDEMVKRAMDRFCGLDGNDGVSLHDCIAAALTAALTVPPPRAEGAEEIAEVLRTFPGKLAGIQDISVHLASRGVRVVTEEQP